MAKKPDSKKPKDPAPSLSFIGPLPSVSRIAEIAKTATSTVVWLLWVLLTGWIVTLVVTGLMRHTIAIEGISVPRALADSGYTSDVAANRLRDALNKYAADALDRYIAPPGSQMRGARIDLQAEMPTIVVPTVGISLTTIVSSLRSLFDIQRHKSISGEFFVKNKLLHLRLRLNGNEIYQSDGGTDPESPDDAVRKALASIFNVVQPYVVASIEPDSERALKLADAIITKFPESDENVVWAYNLKGDIFRDKKRYADAESALRKAVKLNPRLAVPHALLGLVLSDQGKQDSAIQEFTTAIGLAKDFAAAFSNRGAAHDQKKDYDRAIADFSEANRLDSKEAVYVYNRGHVFQEMNKLDLATKDYTEAIRLDPKYELAFSNRGVVFSARKEFDQAITDFTAAIKLNPRNTDYYYNRGSVYQDIREYDKAIADYIEAVRLDPNSVRARINRGSTYSSMEKYDLAIADYSEAIRLNPRVALAYSNRGDSYRKAGNFDEAIADFNRAIQLGLGNPFSYTGRGRAYLLKGDYGQALADYSEALKLDAQDANIYFYLGVVRLYAGAASASLADLRRASQLDGTDGYTALWLDIVAARINAPSPLRQAASRLDMTAWPAPVVRLFLNELTLNDMLAAAQSADDGKRRWYLCEANFYAGQLALRQSSRSLASQLFHAAVADCPRNLIEWFAAKTEAAALDANP